MERVTRTGWGRLCIALSLAWMIVWYLVQRPAINFWFSGLSATPRTLCSDYYSKGDPQLSECEYAGRGDWLQKTIDRDKVPHPFNTYYDENIQGWVIWWWIGVPFAIVFVVMAAAWVRAGFRGDSR
ncbi:MAG: hypothetical protein JSR79_04305 [Proteobacteria bacterium]|nr:hypothetical protein [Pseudomonadota bacterium]